MMEKKNNMKQAMYEMFGVGSDMNEKAASAKSEEKSSQKNSVEVKGNEPMAEKNTIRKSDAVVVPSAAKPKAAAASYLAPGTVLEGNLRSEGDIEVAGEIRGNITTDGTVVLRSNLQGNITANNLNLAGCSLIGDVNAKDTVSIDQHSKIEGNVVAKELLCSGHIIGDLTVGENMVLESTAKVTGNIVTGTIAVMKGAVIKGGMEINTSGK